MRRPLIVPTKGAEWRVSPFLIYDNNGNVVQPANACGPYEERRDVQCVVDDRPVGDSYCRDVGPKPEESKQSFIDTGCSYDWFQGQWQDPGPSCSNAEAQERVVECRRSYDNVKVDDSLCSGSKPDGARTVVDHSTCTYSWNSSDPFADPGQNCTATEEWTRDVFCERDLDKVQVADGQCNAATKPATIDIREDYSSCSYSWDSDETFLDPGASCTDSETQTRAVWCRRDLDDNVEEDAMCDAASRPAASQSVEDYSACSYDWVEGGFKDPGASCTAAEEQAQTVTCLRSDGTTVPNSECDAATKPPMTQTVEDYSACSYSWIEGGFGNWSNTCSASAKRTQTVTCRRSDGTTVSDSSCNAATKPATSETSAVYSGCSYSAVAWTNPANPTCSASNTETQTADCRRSDGTIVGDSECTSRSIALTRSVTNNADYSGCSYSAVNWTNPANPTCSAANTETQTADCRRSDGTIVSDSVCASNGVSLTRTVSNNADYSGCSYSAVNWTNPANPTCSGTNTETQTADCRRSDGTNDRGRQQLHLA